LPGAGGFERFPLWFIWYSARILIIVFSVALLETVVAKMRLFRVTDFLGFAFVLGIIAAACAALGV
jgi:formate hydrogenlyase subunit 4